MAKEQFPSETSATRSLKIIALTLALAGVGALGFEVRFLIAHSFAVYLSRLTLTVLAFSVLLFSQTQQASRHSTAALHILLSCLSLSLAYTSLIIEKTYLQNLGILGLFFLAVSLITNWDSINQAAQVLLFLAAFSAPLIFKQQIRINVSETPALAAIPFLCSILSVFVCFRLNYRRQNKTPQSDNSEETETLRRQLTESENILSGKAIELKQIQEELAALQKELKETQEEIKIKETNSQIVESLKNKIGTPMKALLGSLTLIEKNLYNGEAELREISLNAKNSADSLKDMISNILDLSIITEMKEPRAFNLKEELNKIFSIQSPSLKEKRIKLFYHLQNDVPLELMGDSTEFRQIMLYTLGIAIKHSSQNKLRVLISLGQVKEDLAEILSRISFGMDGKEFQKMLEELEREAPGGITFSDIREMTKKSGGSLEFIEEKDKSQSFLEYRQSFIFKPEEEPIGSDEIVGTQAEDETGRNRKRIILVEEDQNSQKTELKVFRQIGYSIDAVSTSKEAIEAVKSKRFSLMLLSLNLVDPDALETARTIKKLEEGACDIKIIAVTKNSSMTERQRCLEAGIDDYISKPININFLKMTVDRWLND